jgi:hypothetical protein
MHMKVVAVVLTVAAYLAWLGWDQQRNPDGTGRYVKPGRSSGWL